MDTALFGRYFLEFALLYPGVYLCLAPLRNHIKSPLRTYCLAFICTTAVAVAGALLCCLLGCSSNFFLHCCTLECLAAEGISR